MENGHVHDCAPVMRDDEDVPLRQDGDEDGDVEEPPEDASARHPRGVVEPPPPRVEPSGSRGVEAGPPTRVEEAVPRTRQPTRSGAAAHQTFQRTEQHQVPVPPFRAVVSMPNGLLTPPSMDSDV